MEERLKSEFNDAIGFLNRCNQLFYLIDTFSSTLDIFNWYHHLRVLYKELSADMTEKEQLQFKANLDAAGQLVDHAQLLLATKGRVSPVVVDKLDDIEIKLRKLFNDCGYQKKEEQDATKALR